MGPGSSSSNSSISNSDKCLASPEKIILVQPEMYFEQRKNIETLKNWEVPRLSRSPGVGGIFCQLAIDNCRRQYCVFFLDVPKHHAERRIIGVDVL